VLDQPGDQDLTAHVNWSLIRVAGEAEGPVTTGFLPQGRWLDRILAAELSSRPDAFRWSPAQVSQFHALTHPSQMGARFQMLVQSR
jgi:NADH dehydrogenase [ubiquinone] 1 alpha subcomplex assembly factor 7